MDTLERVVRQAVDLKLDAFLIAGDLFEDNQVEDSLVEQVIGIFKSAPAVPILISPGNHDPVCGPESIWSRTSWAAAPAHVHVFREPGMFELGGAVFVANPLRQKRSRTDPSAALIDLAARIPDGKIRVGMTHGSLDTGAAAEDQFPITLQAATRAGLDYLALGHWHQWQVHDGGRLVMPGTPEPDQFGQENAGWGALVTLPERGAAPQVERLATAALVWREVMLDATDAVACQNALADATRLFGARKASTVARVRLSGSADPRVVAELLAKVEEWGGGCFHVMTVDETRVELSAVELGALRQEHPLLGGVLDDLAVLEQTVGGNAQMGSAGSGLTLTEINSLLQRCHIPINELGATDVALARRLILDGAREFCR